MIKTLLLQRLSQTHSITWRNGKFYNNQNQQLDIQDKSIYGKRLSHYIDWCLQNKKGFSYEEVLLSQDFSKLAKKDGLAVRQIDLRYYHDQYLEIIFYPKDSLNRSKLFSSFAALSFANSSVLVSLHQDCLDQNNKIIYANDYLCKETGYQQEEIIGNSLRVFHGENTRKDILNKLNHNLSAKKAFHKEILHYKKSGEEYIAELDFNPVYDQAGWLTHWVCLHRNISDIIYERESIKRLQESAKIGYWRLDLSSMQFSFSHQMFKIFKISRDFDLNYKDVIDFYPRSEHERISKVIKDLTRKQTKSYQGVFSLINSKQEYLWVEAHIQPILNPNGSVIAIYGTLQDITASLEKKQELKHALEVSRMGIFKFDMINNHLHWDDNMFEIYGVSRENFNNDFESWERTLHLDYPQLKKTALQAAHRSFRGEEDFDFTFAILTESGETRFIRGNQKVTKDDTGRPLALIGINQDVTEEYLRNQQRDFILNTLNMGTWQRDMIKGETSFDTNLSRLYGFSRKDFPTDKDCWLALVRKDYREKVEAQFVKHFNNAEEFSIDFPAIKKDGEEIWVNSTGYFIKNNQGEAIVSFGINRDITKEVREDQIKAEEKEASIIQSRLASIGELAAGVGHEINNPLAIATGSLHQLNREYNLNDIKAYQRIEKAHRRIKIITEGLRKLARQDTESQLVDLKDLVEEIVEFVGQLYHSEGIQIEIQSEHIKNQYFMGSRLEIQQVIMNLLSNAKDAISNKEDKLIKLILNSDGDQLTLELSDNGEGIKEENKNKIFDSFFTTKEVGKGTGIGLSLSYKIIKDHRGTISVRSSEGKGSTFTITLPIFKSQVSQSPEQTGV